MIFNETPQRIPVKAVSDLSLATDTDYLLHALQLAEPYRGCCAPNPAVAAVVVKNQKVIAEGWHVAAGHPHAEVMALANLGEQARGATLYVTLEPCCHWGRTPPCTDLIVQAGIQRVCYSQEDPDARVAGKGIAQLRAAGIVCEQITLPAITDFYRSYCYWQRSGKPWVTVKMAMSMDGKIARADGTAVPLTGAELQQFTHEHRRRADAILTTANTIIHDNPQMNVRLHNETIAKPVFVIDRNLRVSQQARVLQTAQTVTLLHDAEVIAPVSYSAQLAYCAIPAVAEGLDLTTIINKIGEAGIHELWVEVGARCFQALLETSCVKQVYLYIALKVLGKQALPMLTAPGTLWQQAQRVAWYGLGRDGVCEVLL